MQDAVLTRDRILDVAEDVLRRFGPAKATVLDVARALGVSHGSVYRHFPSKSALRDAVVHRFLERVSRPLEAIVAEDGPPLDRLHRWFRALIRATQQKALREPEIFATYMALASQSRDVATAHVDRLQEQLGALLVDGMARGEIERTDPRRLARAISDATIRFHHPGFAASWTAPTIDADFEAVWQIVLPGLVGRGLATPERLSKTA